VKASSPKGTVVGQFKTAPSAQRPSQAWAAEARSAVAQATQVESTFVDASACMTNLDDTLDSSSAATSSVDPGASPFLTRRTQRLLHDGASSVTDSLASSALLYNDLVVDGAAAGLAAAGLLVKRHMNTSSVAAAEPIYDDSCRETPAFGAEFSALSVAGRSIDAAVQESRLAEHSLQDETPSFLPTSALSSTAEPVATVTFSTQEAERPPTVTLMTSESAQPSFAASESPNPNPGPEVVTLGSREDIEEGHYLDGRYEAETRQEGDSYMEDFARLGADLEYLARHGNGFGGGLWQGGSQEGFGAASSSGCTSHRTATGESPMPGADRLAGLLGEAEALLRETAITAAMAAAAANQSDPFLDGILLAAHTDPLTGKSTLPPATGLNFVTGDLAAADRLLDAVDGFLGGGAIDSRGTHGGGVVLGSALPSSDPVESLIAPPGLTSEAATVVPSQWVSGAQQWDGGDLGAQLDEICRELDEVVGFTTHRSQQPESSRSVPWPLPSPMIPC